MTHIVDKTFDALVGRPCWKVEWEAPLGLTLSFGEPFLSIREPRRVDAASARVRRLFAHRKVRVRGRWWLWIWCGRWSLSLRDAPTLVTASSSLRRKHDALRWLDGQKLTQAVVAPRTGATRLSFDLGATLRLWGSVSDEREIYSIYKPSGFVLVVRTDGMFSHERGTRRERWRPIAT